MTNSFPTPSNSFDLQSIQYTLNFAPLNLTPGPNLTFAGTQTNLLGALNGLGAAGGIGYTFSVPGQAGAFDQTTAETQLMTIVKDVFQLISDLSGVPVATLESGFTISRKWVWTDSAGSYVTQTDTVPYPPSS